MIINTSCWNCFHLLHVSSVCVCVSVSVNVTVHVDIVACYATSIKLRSKDPQPHVSLATILEELFYLEDLYGFKKEVRKR